MRGHHTSQGVSCCDHHTSVPPSTSNEGLSTWAVARGMFKERETDKYTKRQQAMLDQSLLDEMSGDDDWYYQRNADDSPAMSWMDCKSSDTDSPPSPPRGAPPIPTQSDIMDAFNDDAASRQLALQLAQEESEAPNLRTETAAAKEAARQAAAQQVLGNISLARPSKNCASTVPFVSQQTLDVPSTHAHAGVSQEHEARPRHKSACEIVHQHVTAPPLPRFVAASEATPPLEHSGAADQDPQLLRRSYQHPQLQEAGPIISRPPKAPPPLPQERDDVSKKTRRHRLPPPSLPQDAENYDREHPSQLLRDLELEAPKVQSRRPPPLLPAPCFSVEYFKNHVPLRDHWEVHDYALRHFRTVCRNNGTKAFRMGESDRDFVLRPQCKLRQLSYEGTSWCWHNLVAQLDDESLRKVVHGSKDASGLVVCMVVEGTLVDRRRASAADKPPFSKRKEVLYRWEFALLRDNGTVAFLHPQDGKTAVEYYEGLPKSAVATPAGVFRPVRPAKSFREIDSAFGAGSIEHYFIPDKSSTDNDEALRIDRVLAEQDGSADACKFGGTRGTHEEVVFPSMDSLTLTEPELLHFLHFRKNQHNLRGSATRPPNVYDPAGV